MIIANLGILGTGKVAAQLATLAQAHGLNVRLGSARREARGDTAPAPAPVLPLEEAAAFGEACLLAIPFAACETVLPTLAEPLAGRIVIDATNPLREDWSPLVLGAEYSAGEQLQRLLPRSRVVKAFNTIFADCMSIVAQRPAGHALSAFVCSDDDAARAAVVALAQKLGFAALSAGALSSARYLEAMAHLNIRLAVTLGGGTKAGFAYLRDM